MKSELESEESDATAKSHDSSFGRSEKSAFGNFSVVTLQVATLKFSKRIFFRNRLKILCRSFVSCIESLLRRNLSDAGGDGKTGDSIVQMHQAGDASHAATTLNKVRRTLLERVHAEQRRIDCLDCLGISSYSTI